MNPAGHQRRRTTIHRPTQSQSQSQRTRALVKRFGHINATAPCVKHARPHTRRPQPCMHLDTEMRVPAGGTSVSCRTTEIKSPPTRAGHTHTICIHHKAPPLRGLVQKRPCPQSEFIQDLDTPLLSPHRPTSSWNQLSAQPCNSVYMCTYFDSGPLGAHSGAGLPPLVRCAQN